MMAPGVFCGDLRLAGGANILSVETHDLLAEDTRPHAGRAVTAKTRFKITK